ncbi:MAG: hypothetical protein FJ224_05345 [Lentisphaerae bacterium]|nr:hypothetical protein [Lentisphaerota bacterium]
MSRHVVVSDAHLGSRFCRHDLWDRFLAGLPDGHALILNGDTVDRSRGGPPGAREAALDRLRSESARREVIWLWGNNDHGFHLDGAPLVRYAREHVINGSILVCHGDRFEPAFRRNPMLVLAVRAMYWTYSGVSGKPLHTAAFAKFLRRFYIMFVDHVAGAAAAETAKRGMGTVICGHTHRAEERTVAGVRYVNTGCWTEPDIRFAVSDGDGVRLVRFEEA